MLYGYLTFTDIIYKNIEMKIEVDNSRLIEYIEDKHLNLIKDIRWLTLTYKEGNIEPKDMVNQIDELLNNSYNERKVT
jgi:hypothetical protein